MGGCTSQNVPVDHGVHAPLDNNAEIIPDATFSGFGYQTAAADPVAAANAAVAGGPVQLTDQYALAGVAALQNPVAAVAEGALSTVVPGMPTSVHPSGSLHQFTNLQTQTGYTNMQAVDVADSAGVEQMRREVDEYNKRAEDLAIQKAFTEAAQDNAEPQVAYGGAEPQVVYAGAESVHAEALAAPVEQIPVEHVQSVPVEHGGHVYSQHMPYTDVQPQPLPQPLPYAEHQPAEPLPYVEHQAVETLPYSEHHQPQPVEPLPYHQSPVQPAYGGVMPLEHQQAVPMEPQAAPQEHHAAGHPAAYREHPGGYGQHAAPVEPQQPQAAGYGAHVKPTYESVAPLSPDQHAAYGMPQPADGGERPSNAQPVPLAEAAQVVDDYGSSDNEEDEAAKEKAAPAKKKKKWGLF